MNPLIDTAESLAAALPLLAPCARIPIDTEADSLHCYFEKLCLIQISVPGHDLLIDPLANLSLEPLFAAFEGKELIIHGADYDLRLLRRVGYAGPTSVFDTMIAARLCGIPEFSLAALIKKYFGVELVKGSQKANWARRPLPPLMLDYAVKDTYYLAEIATNLENELIRLGRLEWFHQACEKAIVASTIIKERDPDELWRITGSKDLRDRGSAILRALWFWRDAEAQAVDHPSFHLLHSEQLIDAAARFDREQEVDLPQLHGARRRRFFEAVENQFETEAKFVAEGVSGLQDQRYRHCGEVREGVGHGFLLRHNGFGRVADVAGRVERQRGLLLGEAQHVTVQDRHGVARHGHREARSR